MRKSHGSHAFKSTTERRKGKVANTCNLAVIDELRAERKNACDRLLQAAIQEAQEADQCQPEEPTRKKQKLQKARDCDHLMRSRIVTLTLRNHQLDVLWSVTSPVVWIEYTVANLSFIRDACKAPDAAKGRSRAPRGQRRLAKATSSGQLERADSQEPLDPHDASNVVVSGGAA